MSCLCYNDDIKTEGGKPATANMMMKYIRESLTFRPIAFIEGDYVDKVIGQDFRKISIDRSTGFVYSSGKPVAEVEGDRIISMERQRAVALIEGNVVRDIDNQFERYEVDDDCDDLVKAALFICAHSY